MLAAAHTFGIVQSKHSYFFFNYRYYYHCIINAQCVRSPFPLPTPSHLIHFPSLSLTGFFNPLSNLTKIKSLHIFQPDGTASMFSGRATYERPAGGITEQDANSRKSYLCPEDKINTQCPVKHQSEAWVQQHTSWLSLS